MGFLETGFIFFAIFFIWGIQLTVFGDGPSNDWIADQPGGGFSTIGVIDLDNINENPNNPTPYAAPKSITEENNPALQVSNASFFDVLGFLGGAIWGAGQAIETSGLPSPLNWVLGILVNVFMTVYVFLFFRSIAIPSNGGGSTQ